MRGRQAIRITFYKLLCLLLVNNPMVDTFIKQVVQNTDFKFGMYLDGDSVGFKKQ